MINRRKFLYFTTGLGMALGCKQLIPVYGQQPGDIQPSSATHEYPDLIELFIQETPFTIGRKTGTAVTVNNVLPAPIIRWKEGQTATIKVTNNLKEDTSIHWHGIILPANMDGVPGISFAGIKPGQTFTYQFPINQSGTYWYHSHSGMQEQLGHYGAIIIDPIQPDPFACNRDYVILISDWTFENPHQIMKNLKKMGAYYNYQRRTVSTFFEDIHWRQMRMDPTDIADVTGATYTYLMNGLAPESNWTGLFKPGEKVRLRFINASAMTFFDIRIPGLKMTVIQGDGQNVQPVTVDEFRIGVAETYDVIVEPQDEQAYTIFAETMDRSGYARGTLAIRQGLSAAIPDRRERPLRTMADMGMDHSEHSEHSGHNMSGNSEHSGHSGHSGHDMSSHSEHSGHSGHDMSSHSEHSGHDMSSEDMPNFDWQINESRNHGRGQAGTPMMVKNRLNEPGIGLENTGTRVLVYTDLRSVAPREDQRKPEREIELHLTGNMERYMWSFNGKKYSEEKEITFYYGERLRLTFVNQTMMEHPIHLHGMWMELDNGAGEYKPRKHTVIVKPAEKMSVEVNVDARGKWAFHCHLMYHMEMGMFRTIAVVDRAAEVG
ncbi:copper resistance system multicopper oxidase [Planktothricoides raciborskii]|uniref:Copper resistance system multicopper oxidase n=2 Tax=Planktothricoides raciborskii TaxID=132608 RepID=A0AAU8JF13_9CYAN|nr:copper resistance system multicopper oxidase [Planktothricoides raciborskii]MBD2545207.1 copper resistance system multicopper oxidase [Planktothricoides raciborskii FACHB-1370]MBD2583264.1 copper resistance system multicopper oxidase [Planktothricoides raciborskii FACHB-1261]